MYLNGEVILQVDSVKYLGYHLTNDLHDDLDIRRQCRAINVRSNIIFRKFHMCSVSVKLKLFNSYYASTYILLTCGGTTRKCQFVSCNYFITTYSKGTSDCLNMRVPVLPVLSRILNAANQYFAILCKFVCRLDKSTNTIVKALFSSSIVYSPRIRSHWRGLLFIHGVYCMSRPFL